MAHPIAPLTESLPNTLDFTPLLQTNKVGVTPHCASSPGSFTTSLRLNLGSSGPSGQDLHSSTQLALLTSIFILISTALHSQFQTQLRGLHTHKPAEQAALPMTQACHQHKGDRTSKELKGNSCRSACVPQIRRDSANAQQPGARLPPAAPAQQLGERRAQRRALSSTSSLGADSRCTKAGSRHKPTGKHNILQ